MHLLAKKTPLKAQTSPPNVHVLRRFLTGVAEQLSERNTRTLRDCYASLATPQLPVSLSGCVQGPAAAWRKEQGLAGAGSFGAQALAELAEAAC